MSEHTHIHRDVPPWRDAPALTQCGRDPAGFDVLTVAEASARWKAEGQQRAAYTFCMTCIDRARVYTGHWTSWETDPIALIARDNHGPHADLAKRELHALAVLVRIHADDFAELLAAGDDLADRRTSREGKRQWNRRPS